MIKRILVGLDKSPLAETILPYVTGLAQGLGAEVTLFSVVHAPKDISTDDHHPTLDQLLQRETTLAADYLHQVAERLTRQGVTVHTAVGAGDAPDEIVLQAQSTRMDLIALATHGRSGLQRLMYGSVAEEVLHTTTTPLLLIRPSEQKAPQPIQQIVVPLDGSTTAEQALPFAEAIAQSMKAPIMLVRAVEPVYVTADPATGILSSYDDFLDSLREAAQTYLSDRSADLRDRGLSVNIAVPTGAPAQSIAEYTEAHPGSLLVMATHGRTGVTGLLLGSVARRVVQRTGAPVLLVRATAEEEK